MIVTIVSGRDRPGKFVLAINLAALRARDGCRVLLIDADAHKNAFIWSIRRSNAGMKLKVPVFPLIDGNLYAALQDYGRSYRDVVIDAGEAGSVDMKTALVAAHIAIIPIRPGESDLKIEEGLIKCIETAKPFNPTLRALVVITRASDHTSVQDGTAAQTFAGRISYATGANTVIHDCSSIHGAFEHGLSIFEYQASEASATGEMERLYQEVFSVYGSRSKIAAGIDAVGAIWGRLRGSGDLQRHR
jgi:chromosome partitioning protein